MSDPLFPNVISLLHYEGDNGDQVTTDVIPSTVWSFSGSTQISTLGALMGSSSLLLDGNGDYTSTGPDDKWKLLGSPFCIECIVNPTNENRMNIIGIGGGVGNWNTANGYNMFIERNASGNLEFQGSLGNGSAPAIYTSGTPEAHIDSGSETAICVDSDGTTIKGFVNGTEVFSEDATVLVNISGPVYALYSRQFPSTTYFTGRHDEARVTTASRHQAGYIPATAPFPDSADPTPEPIPSPVEPPVPAGGAYPSTYPCPSWQYGQQITTAERRTPFECGWNRQRREWFEASASIELTFVMGTVMYNQWSNWIAAHGSDWFTIDLDDYGGSNVRTVRATGPATATYRTHDSVLVSLPAELKIESVAPQGA